MQRAILPEKLALEQLHADRGMALNFLGHAGQRMDPALESRLDGALSALEESCRIAAVWRQLPIAACGTADVSDRTRASGSGGGSVVLETAGTRLSLPGSSIAAYLKGARACALLACTLGAGCDARMRQLSSISALDASLFDACANSLIERAAARAQDLIWQAAREAGLYATMRFSPGYGDLPLSVQAPLLDALDARRLIGLHASADCFLVPSKSITAVIGLFAQQDAGRGTSPCKNCLSADYCEFHLRGTTCYAL